MLERLIGGELLTVFLVFCRIGSAVMSLPGFGDGYVPVRVRLLLAMAVTLVVAPVAGQALPAGTAPDAALAGLLLTEIGVGLFLGLVARVMLTALQTAGSVIALQLGLSSALDFDVIAGQQGVTLGTFLATVGTMLVFASDLHHVFLAAIADSYRVFVPGALPPVGDFADAMARIVAESFRLGLQLSAPFLLVGTVVSIGMGLLARLMPQVQVFFIMQPVQIAVGLLAFGMMLGVGMGWFTGEYETAVLRYLGAG